MSVGVMEDYKLRDLKNKGIYAPPIHWVSTSELSSKLVDPPEKKVICPLT